MSRKKQMKYDDWHHRRPSSRNGKNTDLNLIKVNKGKHQSWHHLFKNHHPEIICQIINTVWLDYEFYFTVHKRPP